MVPDYLFKVAKKKQNFGKVARSCSSAKKLLRGQKVAEHNLAVPTITYSIKKNQNPQKTKNYFIQ
jgi:hypothetical protein